MSLINIPRGRQSRLVTWFLLLQALAALMWVSVFWGKSYDDPYITFRYARNLAEGNGPVYNIGERVQSSTTPLYVLTLALIGLGWPDYPATAVILTAMGMWAGSRFLFLLFRQRGHPTAGAFAALLLLWAPLMLSTASSEICLYVGLTLGAFYFYSRGQLSLAMAMAGLVALARPDGALVGMVLVAHSVLTRKAAPWRELVLYAAIVAPWYLFAWVYYGSPLPVTLGAKQHQALLAESRGFLGGLLRLLQDYGRNLIYWPCLPLGVIGLVRIWREDRTWLPLLSWTGAYVVAYTALGVSRYFWYYSPLMPAMIVLVTCGLLEIKSQMRRLAWLRPWALPLTGLWVALLILVSASGIAWHWEHPDNRMVVYRLAGEWLDRHAPSTASVGALEVGAIGYYARRQMIDFAGLIQPRVTQELRRGSSYQDSARWAIQAYQPDYVVCSPMLLGFTGEAWFAQRYRPVHEFVIDDYDSNPLVIYGHYTE